MDAYTILDSSNLSTKISENYFNQLIRDFEIQYLLEKDYLNRVEKHRNPLVVIYETLNALNNYLLKIQSREDLRDVDPVRNAQGHATSIINDIWTSDKRVKTLYCAIEKYCLLRGKDFNVIAIHVAEYRAINKLYGKVSRVECKFKSNEKQQKTTKAYLNVTNSISDCPSFDSAPKASTGKNNPKPFRMSTQNVKVIFNSRPQTWQELQNYVGQLFDEAGFEVEISKVINHIRGKKEVDVYVVDKNSEYHPKILIECKQWNNSVPQEVVHAFHDVMTNYGANTGFIVSKSGFQSGCYEAIKNTNINLVSLEELEEKYYFRWQVGMINRSISNNGVIFPYWGPSWEKMPADGKPISFDLQQLLDRAYQPFQLDSRWLLLNEEQLYDYPLVLPVLNDELKVIGEMQIKNDRDLFVFMDANRQKALCHYRMLYREI